MYSRRRLHAAQFRNLGKLHFSRFILRGLLLSPSRFHRDLASVFFVDGLSLCIRSLAKKVLLRAGRTAHGLDRHYPAAGQQLALPLQATRYRFELFFQHGR